jgi:hypothetical protein
MAYTRGADTGAIATAQTKERPLSFHPEGAFLFILA